MPPTSSPELTFSFDIHLPLHLIGSLTHPSTSISPPPTTTTASSTGPDPALHANRVQTLAGALDSVLSAGTAEHGTQQRGNRNGGGGGGAGKEGGIRVRYYPECLFEDSAVWREDVRRVQRGMWRRGERERMGIYCEGGVGGEWVVRRVGRGVGDVVPGWEEDGDGDGFAGEERAEVGVQELDLHLDGESMWSEEICLSRFHVPVARHSTGEANSSWEKEVRRLVDAIRRIGRVELRPGGWIMGLVPGGTCWPRVVFHPPPESGLPASSSPSSSRELSRELPPAWDQHTLTSALVLLAAFERELLVAATPHFLVHFHPLSHFFTRRAVRAMRRERNKLWTGLLAGDGKNNREGRGRTRAERRAARGVEAWREEMERGDEEKVEKEGLFGDVGGREGWWAVLREMEIEGVVGELGVRRGVGVGFLVGGGRKAGKEGEAESESDTAALKDGEEIYDGGHDAGLADDADGLARPNIDDDARPTEPSPEPSSPFPRVEGIRLPLPIRPLDAAPLIAYTNLLSRILLFASSNSHSEIYDYIAHTRAHSALVSETPLDTLCALAEHVSLSAADVDVLKQTFGGSMREYGDQGVDKDEEERGESEGRRAFRKVEEGLRGRYEGEKREMVRFLARYESVGGFEVPGRGRVYGLMVGGEERGDEDGDDDGGLEA